MHASDWVFKWGWRIVIVNCIHYNLYMDFGTYPIKIGQELTSGVVHAYFDQKLLKSNKIKSFNRGPKIGSRHCPTNTNALD